MDNFFSALKWIVNILNKHSLEYQITGGYAGHLYGSKRQINDIDIDIPEDSFEEIIDDVKEYVTVEPQWYKDEKWDLMLMTLNYHDQEIDIGGAYKTKIFDEDSKKWIHCPADLSKARSIKVDDFEIKICDPYDLIEYKRVLAGDHQIEDIKAIQKYLEDETRPKF